VFSRVFASLSLSASFLLTPALAGHAPARADDLSRAVAGVGQARAAAATATRELVVGTRQWEADRSVLAGLERTLVKATAKLRAEQAEADAGRARVAVVARRMYMSPSLDTVAMAIGMNADEVLSMMRTRGELQHVAGTDSEIVRRAKVAKVRLEAERRDIAAMTQQAKQVAARAALYRRELQALADRTANQLVAAEDALARARARGAARLAAAQAARYRALNSGGAGCARWSTAGMSNGDLDPAVLCTLWRAPGQRLRTDASLAFDTMSQYHAKVLGVPLCVTDSYRSYAAPVDVYRRKPELAAVPGTSQHGWGLAVDLCGGVQTYGSAAFQWMKANAPRFGFHHPSWAEPSGNRPEPWHWEFHG
jgi:hypothetical protein